MFLLACEQNTAIEAPLSTTSEATCGMRVKVIYHFCSFVFLQILDEEHYSLGDDRWRSNDGQLYRHVFMLNNICELGQTLTANDLWEDEFEVTVVTDYTNECAVCLGGYGGKLPDSKLAVRHCVSEEPKP
jgi:hypothetical protein